MPNPPLAPHYHAYIAALNGHTSLTPFVHDHVTHNGRRLTRANYQAMIDASSAAAPDLRFNVTMLVVADDTVAARLWFDCTPEREFLGCRATGRRVRFAEHVFYRFREGRIEEVWSLLDLKAVEEQLGKE